MQQRDWTQTRVAAFQPFGKSSPAYSIILLKLSYSRIPLGIQLVGYILQNNSTSIHPVSICLTVTIPALHKSQTLIKVDFSRFILQKTQNTLNMCLLAVPAIVAPSHNNLFTSKKLFIKDYTSYLHHGLNQPLMPLALPGFPAISP